MPDNFLNSLIISLLKGLPTGVNCFCKKPSDTNNTDHLNPAFSEPLRVSFKRRAIHRIAIEPGGRKPAIHLHVRILFPFL